MRYSLRSKLSLSYVIIIMVCVSLISFLTNAFLEREFKRYIIQNMERRSKDIVESINYQYASTNGWNRDVVENIGVTALESGFIIKVKDISGKIIWDAYQHNSGLCQQMLAHMSKNLNSRYPNLAGGYEETSFPVKYAFKKVGDVEIGYYGPFYLTDNDLAFISTLNKFFIGAGIFSLIFALILGGVTSQKLSKPILRVISTARRISEGDYGVRISEESDTKEICQLTTSINNLAENLESQEKLRKRLTADVAHELRTPLATLQSHMEAMIDGIWSPSAERLKSCHEEIVRIARLVGSLEKLTRYESENIVLNKTEFDLSEVISHIIHNFENDFMSKNITIDFHADSEMMLADKDKISQVMVNLLSNALKYTHEGGRVEVGIVDSREKVQVYVMDNGSGIPEEDLPHVFERFYRVDKSRNRTTGGSGIGLTITKTIVEAHKGTISVTSRYGEGSKFIVELPKDVC